MTAISHTFEFLHRSQEHLLAKMKCTCVLHITIWHRGVPVHPQAIPWRRPSSGPVTVGDTGLFIGVVVSCPLKILLTEKRNE